MLVYRARSRGTSALSELLVYGGIWSIVNYWEAYVQEVGAITQVQSMLQMDVVLWSSTLMLWLNTLCLS